MVEISVIVPVYNVETYLEKCINTLLALKGESYEIILVDDGSKDQSGALCDKYARLVPEKVRVIHQQNMGLSSARNTGIEAAKGKYITFVDSDDWVEPGFLDILYGNIIHTGADLSCCGIIYDSTEGQIPIYCSNENVAMNRRKLFEHILLDPQFYGYACNKMYNKARIGSMRFDTTLRSAEDMDFTVRYACNCSKAVFNKTQLYHYRQRLGSMTGEFAYTPVKLSVLTVNKRLIDIYSIHAPEYRDKVIANFVKTNMNIIGRMGISKHKDSKLKTELKSNIGKYWLDVMKSPQLSLGLKANMLITRWCPTMMLKAKQFILKRKYH